MLGDISYHKATLQSEGRYSIHIHMHLLKIVYTTSVLPSFAALREKLLTSAAQ